ncbi:Fic family protein [[Clostridium] aminophilum]
MVPIQDSIQDSIQDGIQDDALVEFCSVPRSRKEMMAYLKLENRKSFTDYHLRPLLEKGKIVMTIPEKPNSKNQKYVKNKAWK